MTIVDPACSRVWDTGALPAWGTAARADFVVALEQNGPWGRVAATQSHLDPALGAALDAHVSGLGGRLLLIRRPGRHAEQAPQTDAEPEARGAGAGAGADGARPQQSTRRTYIARTGPGGWLVRADLTDPAMLLGLGADELASAGATAGRLGGALDTVPLLLVCTNGRRDACCAQRGRVVTSAFVSGGFATAAPDQVWETSHTGGHRFAPTAVLLPWGRVLARLDLELAAGALDAAASGRLAPALLGPVHDRGPMHLPPAEQAADAWLRRQTDRRDLDDPMDDLREQVDVVARQGPMLPESCGKAAVPTIVYAPSWRA